MSVVAIGGSAIFICALGVLVSLAQVDQNQYGLVFNWVTKRIGVDVYHGGTHFIGFWNRFVLFPATVQTIEFSKRDIRNTADALHTRTKEGLALYLDIAFQYRLQPEGLPALYKLTNMQYESLFVRIARDQILGAASAYEGPQYWLERKEIGDQMRNLVHGELNQSHADLWDFQLLRIDLPDQYESSITGTQVQEQMVKTRKNEQVAAGIRVDTEIMQAEFHRKIRVVQAGADANYSLVTKLAEAEAQKRRIAAEADALRYTRANLKLSSVGAVKYQQLGAFAGLENATFLADIFGANGANPVMGIGPSANVGSFLQESATTMEDSPSKMEHMAKAHSPDAFNNDDADLTTSSDASDDADSYRDKARQHSSAVTPHKSRTRSFLASSSKALVQTMSKLSRACASCLA